jgi:AbrB family looped-hinge helix DNA binding protein
MPLLDTAPLEALPPTFRGTLDGMKTTIDRAGRVVIPKGLRDALRLNGGDEVEITLEDERIELVPAPRQTRLRKGAHGVLTSDLELPPHGPEEVRAALERARR